jgi:hypothetical protein
MAAPIALFLIAADSGQPGPEIYSSEGSMRAPQREARGEAGSDLAFQKVCSCDFLQALLSNKMQVIQERTFPKI